MGWTNKKSLQGRNLHYGNTHKTFPLLSLSFLCPLSSSVLKVSFNAVIDAFARRGDWDSALGVLGRMHLAGVPPSTITYNTVIASGAKSCSKAISLLMKMLVVHSDAEQQPQPAKEQRRIPPADMVSYLTVIYLCVNAGSWEEAVKVLKLLQEDRHQNGGGSNDGVIMSQEKGKHGSLSNKTTITLEDLDALNMAFDRCDEDLALRVQARECLEVMRAGCEARYVDV